MKRIILFLSVAFACGLLLTNMFSSLVDAKSWGSDIPNSIAAARIYFKAVNPGDFYRVFSPINQVLGLLVLALFWKTSPSIRIWLGAALAMYVLADVMTFAYFYPRNDILFRDAPLTEVDTLKRVWAEWNATNWIRSFVLLVGIFFSFLALNKIYIHHLRPVRLQNQR